MTHFTDRFRLGGKEKATREYPAADSRHSSRSSSFPFDDQNRDIIRRLTVIDGIVQQSLRQLLRRQIAMFAQHSRITRRELTGDAPATTDVDQSVGIEQQDIARVQPVTS